MERCLLDRAKRRERERAVGNARSLLDVGTLPTTRGPRRKAAQRKAAKANRLPMLYADKRALETNLKVSLLAIREKELNYYVSALAARLP